RGVAPGDYRLESVLDSELAAVAETGSSDAVTYAESVSVPLNVAGQDLRGLALGVSPRGTLSGRIVLEDEASGVKADAVKLFASAADQDGLLTRVGGISVNKDGTFYGRGMIGRRLLQWRVPRGWTVGSIKLDGVDVVDAGIDFGSGKDVSGVEVMIRKS